MRKLSKSGLNTYLDCQRKFYYAYIKNLPTTTSPQMQRGKDVHSFIENFYSRIQMNGTTFDISLTDTEKNNMAIMNFLMMEKTRLKKIIEKQKDVAQYFYPVKQEITIETDELKGIVDAIYLNPDDEYVIFDWKTGKSGTKMNSFRELSFYKVVLDAAKLLPKPIKYGGMYYLDENKLLFDEFRKEWISSVMKLIEGVIFKIKSSGNDMKEYPMNIDFHCSWCDFRDRCF